MLSSSGIESDILGGCTKGRAARQPQSLDCIPRRSFSLVCCVGRERFGVYEDGESRYKRLQGLAYSMGRVGGGAGRRGRIKEREEGITCCLGFVRYTSCGVWEDAVGCACLERRVAGPMVGQRCRLWRGRGQLGLAGRRRIVGVTASRFLCSQPGGCRGRVSGL